MKSPQSINQSKTRTIPRILTFSSTWETYSLVCDFMELYRYLIDDFLIEYCRNLKPKDFVVKTENNTQRKLGKREYFNYQISQRLMKCLDTLFESNEVPRIKVGMKQSLDTLINEEALLLAKFLRKERRAWNPRIIITI